MAKLTDYMRERLLDVMEDAVRGAVDTLESRLDEVVPVRTGALRDSAYSRVTRNPDGIVATIGYSAPQAAWTNDLIEPHPIPLSPKPRGTSLAFWWEREGRMFYGPQVNHPGNANSQSLHWFSDVVNQENFVSALKVT